MKSLSMVRRRLFKFLENKSFRGILGITYLLGISAMAIFVSFTLAIQTEMHLTKNLREESYAAINSLVKDSRLALLQVSNENVKSTVDSILAIPYIQSIAIFTADGAIIVGSSFLDTTTITDIIRTKNPKDAPALLTETSHYIELIRPVYVESYTTINEFTADPGAPLKELQGYLYLRTNKSVISSVKSRLLDHHGYCYRSFFHLMVDLKRSNKAAYIAQSIDEAIKCE